MSAWSTLGKILGIGGAAIAAPLTGGLSLASVPGILTAAGTAASAAANTAAHNRGAAADLSLDTYRADLDRAKAEADNAIRAGQLDINRSAENRTERDDAWKRLMMADYVLNRGGYTNPMGLPSFGIARTGSSTSDQKAGAEGLKAEVLKRLIEGSPITAPTVPSLPSTPTTSQYAKPGGWEQLFNLIAPSATILNAARRGIGSGVPTTANGLPTMQGPVGL